MTWPDPHSPQLPHWPSTWSPFSSFSVEHQNMSWSCLVHWWFSTPLYLNGKTHFFPEMAPDIVKQSPERCRLSLILVSHVTHVAYVFHLTFIFTNGSHTHYEAGNQDHKHLPPLRLSVPHVSFVHLAITKTEAKGDIVGWYADTFWISRGSRLSTTSRALHFIFETYP